MQESHTPARELLDNVLSNTHKSLKWSWQIVMGFALVTAVEEMHGHLLGQQTASNSDKIFSVAVFFVGFIPLFIRFFYGENRYIDLAYLELRSWNDSAAYRLDLEYMSIGRRVADMLFLLSHGILFIFIAKTVDDAEMFFVAYSVILANNVALLFLTVKMNRRRVLKEAPSRTKYGLVGMEKETTEFPKRDRAPMFWLKNNFLSLVGLGTTYSVLGLQFQIADRYWLLCTCLSICAANSVADLWTQREFYWPKFHLIYDHALREQRGRRESQPQQDLVDEETAPNKSTPSDASRQ